MKDFSEEIYVNFEEEWYEHLETYKPGKLLLYFNEIYAISHFMVNPT